jgi:CBS domain-containing protein
MELPLVEQQALARQIDVRYYAAGSTILEYNAPLDALYLIRSGIVETFRRNGDLYNRLAEGGLFAEQGLLRGKKVRFPAKAVADTLIYLIPAAAFEQLFDNNEYFADYIEIGDTERQANRKSEQPHQSALMTVRINELLNRPAVTLPADASIVQAAQLMRSEGVSCLLLTAPGTTTQIAGLITDRDLRNRVLADELSPTTAVAEIMTQDLVTIAADQFVFEAMLKMLRHNLHHLPVLQQQQPVGVIAIADIIRHESNNSLYIVSSIFRQQTVTELSQLTPAVQACFVRMVHEDANSQMIGSAMATIGRAFKQRLLELAEQQLGPPPVPYCFVALGSMARDEQLIVTDQDNAIILDDRFEPALHDAYFSQLATFVCDGLAACGYPYCSGKIMATNSRWRQPLGVWQQYFTDWIQKPRAETLLHSNIFFDLDAIYGVKQFAEVLNQLIAKQAPDSKLFLASMTRNALLRTPPLGFFQDFVMDEDGKQNDSLNIKRRGTAPFTDLIRVYALSLGSTQRNSYHRLQDIAKANILPKGRAADLRDAFELIAMTRIRHQAYALQQKLMPDNNVRPAALSEFERKQLKAAFQILANAQKFLKFHFQA